MKKTNRFFNLSLLLLLFFTACVNESKEDEKKEPDPNLSIIAFYEPWNNLGDNFYSDYFYYGVHKAAYKNNALFDDVCPFNWEGAETSLRESILDFQENDNAENSYVLYIFSCNEYLSLIKKVLEEKTFENLSNINFLVFNSREKTDYASTAYLPLYGASYLAGVATKAFFAENINPRIMAILSNQEDSSLMEGLEGFSAGYEHKYTALFDEEGFWLSDKLTTESFIATQISVFPDFANPDDQAAIIYKELTNLQNNELIPPFELYLPLCGSAIHGMLRYSREVYDNPKKKFSIVGQELDCSQFSRAVPFSVLRYYDKAIEKCLEQWIEGIEGGEGLPAHQDFTLEDGYTDLIITEGQEYTNQLKTCVNAAREVAILAEKNYEK